jgi:hypothetical protein
MRMEKRFTKALKLEAMLEKREAILYQFNKRWSKSKEL